MKRILILLCLTAFSARATLADPGSALRSAMQKPIDRGELPGLIYIVADRDTILEEQYLGMSDLAGRKKMSPDALFWIASQSKPFAGVAVMMLVEEGKLDLDTPVAAYLPELKQMMVRSLKKENFQVLEKAAKSVTLRHLLSHTGGMTFLGGVQEQTGKIDLLSLENSIYVTAITPLLFEPGENYEYSNQGINIAAAIVERASGMSYEAFLQKRIFEPLGMSSATFFPEGKQLSNLILPHTVKEGKMEEMQIGYLQYPLSDRSKRHVEAGGGIFCSPRDLLKFYRMVAAKGIYSNIRIVSEESVRQMGEAQTCIYPKSRNGLGWAVSDSYMGHGGALGSDTKVYKKSGLIVMYIVQGDFPKQHEAFALFEQTVKQLYSLE
ncbi:MAG: beta-lactamase family protein [Prevotellaceae bacterium]|jgi:CubicO group peptidase (beta-lactamase class C family)|nr:beta-lactamase family protein [Prevotellaceae bacterium]